MRKYKHIISYTSKDLKAVLEQLDEGEQSDQKELPTEISSYWTITRKTAVR